MENLHWGPLDDSRMGNGEWGMGNWEWGMGIGDWELGIPKRKSKIAKYDAITD